MDALRTMASKGDEEAKKWLESRSPGQVKKKTDDQKPVMDDLGYFRPPTKHTIPKIGDVYRLNDAKMHTGKTNSLVLIKEKKGEYVTAWTVTREPGKGKSVMLLDPAVAGLATAKVFVLTDTDRVMHREMLAEYKGSLSTRDAKQFRLSV